MNLFCVAVLTSIIAACPFLAAPQADEDEARKRDEYAVYSAVISEKFVREDTRLIIITDQTCCDISELDKENLDLTFGQLGPLLPETMSDFRERNKQPLHVQRAFKLAVPYRIVDYKDIETLFASMVLDEEWKKFYRLYPQSNGYIRLSRVGFNKGRTEALLNTGWMRGERYGEGRYFLLLKSGEQWRIVRSVMTWVS